MGQTEPQTQLNPEAPAIFDLTLSNVSTATPTRSAGKLKGVDGTFGAAEGEERQTSSIVVWLSPTHRDCTPQTFCCQARNRRAASSRVDWFLQNAKRSKRRPSLRSAL